jgi:hypothetical protein
MDKSLSEANRTAKFPIKLVNAADDTELPITGLVVIAKEKLALLEWIAEAATSIVDLNESTLAGAPKHGSPQVLDRLWQELHTLKIPVDQLRAWG